MELRALYKTEGHSIPVIIVGFAPSPSISEPGAIFYVRGGNGTLRCNSITKFIIENVKW